ncbi:hypothetical protein A5780_38765 [Nocardia sp. 852002-20019_SCH5090214]|uniref:hypothetical protein n=1 Tax=Nocardia sp. 852002-20019_SCH5090214 TaxID=1834087 RepID=UPI0007E9FA4A|nr:hypothetical protein [Nocardia sp. 852002-20019_SCH5090214]OBA43821.1 hypothetical protein A5780_38765 [Nocardia sp. 852002-20019_SCH5090214]
MLWLGLAGVADDDAVVDLMPDALSTQLDDGIAYYCRLTQSTVGLLPGAEEKRQRLDAAGNLLLDEALTGAVREAHYAGLEDRALGFVDDSSPPTRSRPDQRRSRTLPLAGRYTDPAGRGADSAATGSISRRTRPIR